MGTMCAVRLQYRGSLFQKPAGDRAKFLTWPLGLESPRSLLPRALLEKLP